MRLQRQDMSPTSARRRETGALVAKVGRRRWWALAIIGGVLTSLTNVAPPGESVTYRFTASEPGTYIYESGTEPDKQMQMGLVGALIVRPKVSDVPGGIAGH